MPSPLIISASILAADFARLGEEATSVLDAGADWLHIDVMDNHYVPNLSVGPAVCAALRRFCPKDTVLDVHLMAAPVDALIVAFAEAGANRIAIHPAATTHVHRSMALIREKGCEAGLVFNPAEQPQGIEWLGEELDFVLLMTVNPGFGGQSLLTGVIPKIARLRQSLRSINRPIRVQVDGGVNDQNVTKLVKNGADTLVVGSHLFNAGNRTHCIERLRRLALS